MVKEKDIFSYPLMKIGIIGGGQLGRMMAQKAKKMGFYVSILDPTLDSPAGQVADSQIIGGFYDTSKLKRLVQKSDVTTYDIEHINAQPLKDLFDQGYKIYPSPYLLETIQDKLKQKDILSKAKLPLPKYKNIETAQFAKLKPATFPCVQKARKGGYDGRGVVVLRNKNDLRNLLKTDSILEEFVQIEKELAVMAVRSVNGETKVYPVAEMIFDQRENICDMVIVPARINKCIHRQAQKIALKAIEAFDGIGIFGVEMFLTKKGEILINEIAPRPHNSGHYTIEACQTCQFEQHIRAITGLPLGSTDLLSPAVMINLLGEKGYEGRPIIEGLKKALSIPGVSFHFYGKKITKPFRKMGHLTLLNKSLDYAVERVKRIKHFLKIKGENLK